jgi:hypothetical protein
LGVYGRTQTGNRAPAEDQGLGIYGRTQTGNRAPAEDGGLGIYGRTQTGNRAPAEDQGLGSYAETPAQGTQVFSPTYQRTRKYVHRRRHVYAAASSPCNECQPVQVSECAPQALPVLAPLPALVPLQPLPALAPLPTLVPLQPLPRVEACATCCRDCVEEQPEPTEAPFVSNRRCPACD